MYVLKCSTGKYEGYMVSKPGRKSSYTKSLNNARIFNTREEAVNNSCIDNEFPVYIELKPYNN